LPVREAWDKIPSKDGDASLDILVVHGPPLGRGDKTKGNGHAGCYDLLRAIQDRVKPRVCIFGHIHEGYGCSYDGTTLYVNASSLDYSYDPVNRPIVIDFPHNDKSQSPLLVHPVNTKVASKDEFQDWCSNHGYDLIARAIKSCNPDRLPIGDDLLHPQAWLQLIDVLNLHRSTAGRSELAKVLSHLYAESFE
jgi:hypothetical protein